MGRAVWFAAGAGAGVYAMVRARRVAEAFTPDGLADRLAGLSLGAHLFGQEVRAGAAEKEQEVRARLGVPPGGQPQHPGHLALAAPGRHRREAGEPGAPDPQHEWRREGTD